MTPVKGNPDGPAAAAGNPAARAPFIPHQPTWFQRAAARVITICGKALAASLRTRWSDPSNHMCDSKKIPVIYCTWHNRLAVSLPVYDHFAYKRRHAAGLAALVSASKDGALLVAVLECFRAQPVRGSSSRRGPRALLELTTWAAKGYDIAITPDGPRGPACVAQGGVIALAQATGLAVVPWSYYARWKVRLKSWDRFEIPLPFSRCEMRIGRPLWVPRDASEAQRETLRQEIERALNELSRAEAGVT
jgi:lysophospholipid acyltransferase (LPLAT)-like uncharacterized protein